MIKLIKVTGNSLSPSFLDGDYVIIRSRNSRAATYEPGDVVVVNHRELGLIIKQVLHNHPDLESLELMGTHPASISAKKIGLVPYHSVLGKVLFHIKRPR